MTAQLTSEMIEQYRSAFDIDPKNVVAMNAVTKIDAKDAALDRNSYNKISHIYSNTITTGTATAQGKTGRCWMFAGLNVLRIYFMRKMKMKEFEFSQSYLMFCDKLEKGNYFLEDIIKTREEETTSRVVMWLLENIIPDAGQWDMFVNLIKKYGVLPKSAMLETMSSSESQIMNSILKGKLRDYAVKLREMHAEGKSVEEMRKEKNHFMEEYYRILCIHMGQPPKHFDYNWRDTDDEYHRVTNITPLEFYSQYVSVDLDQMVCIINSPTKDKPFNKMYTVEYLGNIVGGKKVRYLNLDIDTMVKASAEMIRDDHPVWFGADAMKYNYRDKGIFNIDIFNYKTLYGTDVEMDKATRLDYGQSKMNHAMVFTGVDMDDKGNPISWRVENSWGEEAGEKGFFSMSTDWFKEYNYEVVVHRDYVPAEALKVLDTEPVALPPWDPMGALA